MPYLLPKTHTVTPQYNRIRRGNTKPSGTFVIHTAENKTDTVGPDSGDNSVMAWIKQRPNYGSYHSIHDSDSSLLLAPIESETFHCRLTNRWSVGISAAVASADWKKLYRLPHGEFDRGRSIIDRMAADAANKIEELKTRYGIHTPIKKITRSQALRREPGFIGHGETDPGRRTDPGKDFDWDFFLSRVKHHLGEATKPTPTPEPQPEPEVEKDTFLMALTDHEQNTLASNVDKTKMAVGRSEQRERSMLEYLAVIAEALTDKELDGSLRKRVEQTNAAVGRLEKAYQESLTAETEAEAE